jgi:desulfoferrodoxin-like iron-binding protein
MHAGFLPVLSDRKEDLYMVNVSKEGQVFKCEICYNIVVVKEVGGGELVCCGEPMKLESA